MTEKSNFFALYNDQRIQAFRGRKDAIVDVNPMDISNQDFLILTPVDQITDEHAMKCIEMYGALHLPTMILTKVSPIEKIKKGIAEMNYQRSDVADMLRSWGYILHWKEYSIEAIINNGWAQLKESKDGK